MSNNHFRNLPVPFLSQRQNDYLWYKRDKDNFVIANQTPVSMDCRTCNITSVMMVMKYLGLTGIERIVNNITFTTPSTPKEFLTKYFNHEYDSIFTDMPTFGVTCLEDWNNLKKIASDIFGADCTYDSPDSKTISLETVKDEIAAGYPVCISIGINKIDSTNYEREGHVVVVRGFTQINSTEYIILNDPWGSIVDDEYNVYEISEKTSLGSNYYPNRDKDSRTNGDNVIVKLSDFKGKLVQGTENSTDSDTFFHNVMTIRAPLWNFPDGTNDFSDDKKQADIYNKFRVLNGGYPINKNNVWHTGVHLAIDGEIHSIGPASLIAVRNSKVPDDSFDRSFVLLEHKINQNNEIQTFYSLYMHLKYFDLKEIVNNYFSRGEKCNYPWLNQLLNKMLCYSLVVKNFDSDSDTMGQINDSYKNIKLYKVNIQEDGTLIKESTVASKNLGRRCLITPLPVKNQKIYTKLLDPEKYNDDDFKSDMQSIKTYKYNDFIYFYLDGTLYATKYNDDYFEYGLIFYKQLLKTAKQIFDLSKGKIVTFSNGDDYTKLDVSKTIKETLKKNKADLSVMLKNRFNGITNSNNLNLNIGNPFLDIIDLCSIASNSCCNTNELKTIQSLYETYMNDYLTIYKDELKKYIKSFEDNNKILKEDLIKKEINNESKTWRTYLQETCIVLLEKTQELLNIQIDIPKDFTNTETKKDGNALVDLFIKEINKTELSYSNKIVVYETLILWLIKIPANNIDNFSYFENGDSSIALCMDKIISKNGLIKGLISIYNGTFTYFLENQIEIAKNEIIGNCGNYETLKLNNEENEEFFIEPQIHFEIFSAQENIMKAKRTQEDLDDDIIYHPDQCIGTLADYIKESVKDSDISIKYLDDNLLQISELYNLYKITDNKFLYDLALNIKNPWGEKKSNTKLKYYKKKYFELSVYDNEEKLRKKKKLLEYDEYYDKYIKPYMWFYSDIFTHNEFQNECAWYYHPIYFIEKFLINNI